MLEKEKYENRKWWIDQHRKMWATLSWQVQRSIKRITELKKEYVFKRYGYENMIFGCCFCCEYAYKIAAILEEYGYNVWGCEMCPIKWKDSSCFEEYDETLKVRDPMYLSQLCKSISCLPENTEPKFIIRIKGKEDIVSSDQIIRLHNKGEVFLIKERR